MDKISVIIPMHNTEEFVGDCLSSLKNQTYDNLEIIIVDDKSTDNSLEIVQEYAEADDRMIVYSLDEQKGVGYARNYGIEKATGAYVYFLDSDDFLPRETLSILMNNIGGNVAVRGSVRSSHLSSAFTVTFDGNFNPITYTDNRYNLLHNLKAKNFLIKKEFVDEHNLKFSESHMFYTDLFFLLPFFKNITYIQRIKEAVYFQRLRNDPILNPSLSQTDSIDLSKSFIKVFVDLKQTYSKDNGINAFLDKRFLNYYRKEILIAISTKEDVEVLFEHLRQAVSLLGEKSVANASIILRRELKPIQKNNIKRYKKIMKRHNAFRELKESLGSRRRFYYFLYNHVFTKLPIKSKLVFFESFLGKNYSDSPKYIYEYMNKHKKKYKAVWSFNEKKKIPGRGKQVERFSLKYFYYLARAKYWVSNSRLPVQLTKRKENIYLQTWHGTPLKRLVFDMDDVYSADPNYKKNFYIQSRRWDYLSSPNEYSSNIFQRAFVYNKEMLEFGYPRNDILYKGNNNKEIKKIKKKLNIPLNKKVVLYAPTWRDDDYIARGKYNFSLKLNLEKMQQRLGDDYIVLLRMHYFIANSLDISQYEGFAYDVSTYDDIAELYLASDLLITDYSSVFFDYANLKRPIIFFTYDLEKYRDTLRGFYLDIESEVPGPLLKTSDEVIDAIETIETVKEEYEEIYDAFYKRFCLWDDGKASEKTVNKVFK